jgi:hypothetical protein
MKRVDDFNWDGFFEDGKDRFRKHVEQIIARYRDAKMLAEENRRLSKLIEFEDADAQSVISSWIREHERSAAHYQDILKRLGFDPSA